jgi:hypothetical protein
MQKRLRALWELQAIANAEIGKLAPDLPIVPFIQWDDEAIVWDEECQGLGRVPWRCCFFVPVGHPARILLPKLNGMMAAWQARYELALTCRLSGGDAKHDPNPHYELTNEWIASPHARVPTASGT